MLDFVFSIKVVQNKARNSGKIRKKIIEAKSEANGQADAKT
jgi:hypothetical protein